MARHFSGLLPTASGRRTGACRFSHLRSGWWGQCRERCPASNARDIWVRSQLCSDIVCSTLLIRRLARWCFPPIASDHSSMVRCFVRVGSTDLPAESEVPSGIVVSLADDLLDLVVAKEISVRRLQITVAPSPRHVFRVSQRFTMRIKQPTALVALV